MGARRTRQERAADPSVAGHRVDAALAVGAIGVVFGDIGTSTLYTFSSAFGRGYGLGVTAPNVLGVLSLVLWTLLVMVTLKYVTFVMRADSRGEGGIVVLMAMARRVTHESPALRVFVITAALIGAALFFGDGVITPAITVLSAVEGLEIAAPAVSRWTVWIAIAVLVALFAFQKRGTGQVGQIFGPVMCLWFVAQGALGVYGIAHGPAVLRAFNPLYGLQFVLHHGGAGFLVLGAVVLCTTGAEALYADMGHFGRRAITAAWYVLVLPCLVLNYLGQGAVLLHDPAAAHNPFFLAAPGWALYPLVILATLAAVIASEAVISGAFSMMRQLISLGFMPRMQIAQTSREEAGQIYVPTVNVALMILVVAAVVGFRSSGALAGAYGIAVTGTMVTTTLLFAIIARRMWRWPVTVVAPLVTVFLFMDLAFFGANIAKLDQGGWFPLALAAVLFIVMTTWARGRMLLRQHLASEAESPEVLLKRLEQDPPHRIPGTAVFPTSGDMVPPRLFYLVERQRVLQDYVLLVTVETQDVPRVPATERLEIIGLSEHIHRVILKYGFMQEANIPVGLRLANKLGLEFDVEHMTYYIGREMIVVDASAKGMANWRQRLFAYLSRNAMRAPLFYRLPPEDVVELGFPVRL